MSEDGWTKEADTLFRQIGHVLSQTRERRGLTLSDVQAQTHIRSRYLEAMEAGDFQVIPGEVYARGFLRTYARFLELEETELMRMYEQAWQELSGVTPVAAAAVTAPAAGKAHRAAPRRETSSQGGPDFKPQRGVRFVVPVMLLLAVAGAVAFGLYYLGTGFGLPAEGDSPPAEPPGQTVAEPPPAEPEPPLAEPEPPAVAVERLTADPARPNYVTYAVSHQSGPVDVTVRTGAACWYRATSGGKIVAEGTLQAGTELTWTLTTDLTVHLGNPADITVTIGGEFSDKVSAQQPQFLVVQGQSGP